MSQLHLMVNGQSVDVALVNLDLGDLSTNEQVRDAAAKYLGQAPRSLANFQVDRNQQTGDITLRPQAIFGNASG